MERSRRRRRRDGAAAAANGDTKGVVDGGASVRWQQAQRLWRRSRAAECAVRQ